MIQYILGFVLCLIPRVVVSHVFFSSNGQPAELYFSGRVALFRLASAVKKQGGTRVVLPDYVCNVVHKAFLEAGLEIDTFPTSNTFEPDIDQIKLSIESSAEPAILCLAPIMGSEGGVEWVLSDEGRGWRARHRITLIIDMCQDFSRARSLAVHNDHASAVITSFNDKSFPGCMGAAVWGDLADCGFDRPGFSEEVKIFRFAIKRVLVSVARTLRYSLGLNVPVPLSSTRPQFDFSYCDAFPYDLHHGAATRLQVGVAAAGVICHGIYASRRKKISVCEAGNVIQTPFSASSPFILVNQFLDTRRRRKLPYALHFDPENSQRPDLKVQHRKGFDDFL